MKMTTVVNVAGEIVSGTIRQRSSEDSEYIFQASISVTNSLIDVTGVDSLISDLRAIKEKLKELNPKPLYFSPYNKNEDTPSLPPGPCALRSPHDR